MIWSEHIEKKSSIILIKSFIFVDEDDVDVLVQFNIVHCTSQK